MAMSNQPRMATDIPASITIPDRVESRLGALTFTDGFPDDATVEKVFDNLDFQRAVQAFLTAMPAASIRAQRRAFLEFGPANQTVLIFETLMDSRSLFLTANTESVYILAWIELSEGPVVVDAPPGMLGIVDDAWFHYVADIGLAGPDKGQGGRFVFVGPDHRARPRRGRRLRVSVQYQRQPARSSGVRGRRRPGTDGASRQRASADLPARGRGGPAADELRRRLGHEL